MNTRALNGVAPLLGLVLAGGRSTRMRTDKAALRYGGRSQLERAMELITPHVQRAYVSVRADQTEDPLRARSYLVRSRAPDRSATAYRSSHDGLPEPLCAIWEPRSAAPLAAYVARGRQCPRRFLLEADTQLLDEPNPHALDNINTPEEYRSVMSELLPESTADSKHITVQYYALLREQAGRREEAVVTRARTPAELYAQLAQRYPFSLTPEVLRVAINAEFREWTAPLADGDAVVFIPPVAGG